LRRANHTHPTQSSAHLVEVVGAQAGGSLALQPQRFFLFVRLRILIALILRVA
jgi:hypothetical protein